VTLRIAPEDEKMFRWRWKTAGIGIGADEMPRLFQEFAQLPNSRQAEQGTGLGLALTRHIVEAQGGTVAVQSEPGRGSVFSAILPLDNTIAAPSKTGWVRHGTLRYTENDHGRRADSHRRRHTRKSQTDPHAVGE
jgi:K+-sensing histidine kinase KdpD